MIENRRWSEIYIKVNKQYNNDKEKEYWLDICLNMINTGRVHKAKELYRRALPWLYLAPWCLHSIEGRRKFQTTDVYRQLHKPNNHGPSWSTWIHWENLNRWTFAGAGAKLAAKRRIWDCDGGDFHVRTLHYMESPNRKDFLYFILTCVLTGRSQEEWEHSE